MKITENTTLGALKKDAETAPLVPFLLYNRSGDGAGRLTDDNITLRALQEKDPAWQADCMAYGLNAYRENAEKAGHFIFPVYGEPAVQANPELKDVKLVFFPAEFPCKGKRKTALLAAGGAYGAVCSLPESFPVAAELSQNGVDVFCLNYRVADGNALFPRPMEDLRAAVRYLSENEKALGIDMTHFAVGGFSAGAHLAGCYGTEELGYISSNLPKPELLILVYPLINVWETTALLPEPIRSMMRNGYLGEDASEETCRLYNVDEQIWADYPAVWMIQSADDPVVPFWNTERMAKALEACRIPFCYEKAAGGGHGWGLGNHTAAEGWTARMLNFWNTLQNGDKNEAVRLTNLPQAQTGN